MKLDRKQRVVLGEYENEWKQITSGVHQGIVLSPLLFLIFINDFQEEMYPHIIRTPLICMRMIARLCALLKILCLLIYDLYGNWHLNHILILNDLCMIIKIS